jgi:murein lipoprotein
VSPTHDTVEKAVAEAGGIMVKLRHPSCGRLHRLREEELKMKNTLVIKIAAVAAFAALAGCTDLKPLQADIDSLKTQVGTLSSDVAAIKADRSAANAAAAAQTSATSAGTAAAAAQSAANAASAKADAAQAAANAASAKADAATAAVTDLNTKVDRMFQKSVSK